MPLSRTHWLVMGLIALVLVGTMIVGVTWSSRHQSQRIAHAVTGGDAQRAPAIMRRYGCAGCHTIPGVPGADGQVGGSLAGLVHRVYLAGHATNSPDNLIRWIVSPQSFSPQTAMPTTGISEIEARDVAAYLYAQ